MSLLQDVRVVSRDWPDDLPFDPVPPPKSSHYRFAAPLRNAIVRTRQWLLSEQHEDGYWVGELEGDSILESETVLLLAFLGQEQSELAQRAAERLIEQQLPGGGWTMYTGGDIDISGSVKAYFALKLTGHDPSASYMVRARRAILAQGGASRVNSFTRYYLALLGQISYDHCPHVPPEAILLPRWFPVNIYQVSAWSRTIIVPLSVISASRPVKKVASQRGIRELFLEKPADWPATSCPGTTSQDGPISWNRFFCFVDRSLKFFQKCHFTPLRRRAIARAEQWILEHFKGSDGLGSIFPPIVWSTVALDCLGHSRDSDAIQYCLRQLEDLVIDAGNTVRIQPCKSPVWDTAITLCALTDSGVDRQQTSIRHGVDWLLAKEVRYHGDWSATVKADPGGWSFEHNNQFYPDLDDTAMVLLALRGQLEDPFCTGDTLPPKLQLLDNRATCDWQTTPEQVTRTDRISAAAKRAVTWTLAMQNKDGGWGAFDRNNDREFLCRVPFADHNAMIDPSTPDVTARILEALGAWGYESGHPAVKRAIAYLQQSQQADGSWFGRWGVNYIYGTWQALTGLSAVGIANTESTVIAGAEWLLAHQQPSGGWGESPDSYAQPHLRGQGPTTASQTAWALLGLMMAGRENHPAVARGVRFLLDRQEDDGTWDEPQFTGTGFPQVFYLRYHMYSVYFPLMALSRFARAVGTVLEEAETARIRLADTTLLATCGS